MGNWLSTISDSTWAYNDRNQLVTKGDTAYNYDANGNRVKKTVTLPGTTTEITHYIYNTEERLIRVEDTNNNAVGIYYYNPFGLRLKRNLEC